MLLEPLLLLKLLAFAQRDGLVVPRPVCACHVLLDLEPLELARQHELLGAGDPLPLPLFQQPALQVGRRHRREHWRVGTVGGRCCWVHDDGGRHCGRGGPGATAALALALASAC